MTERAERGKYITLGTEQYLELLNAFALMRARIVQLQAESLVSRITGAPNDLAFERYLNGLADQYSRLGKPTSKITIVYGDLKRFKDVNDLFGDVTGNAVLREVAGVLQNTTRPEEICCHMWGDSFAFVLLTDKKKGVSSAMHRFERVVSDLRVSSLDPERPGIIKPKIKLSSLAVSANEPVEKLMRALAKHHFEKTRD